jgi:hypothetical protein
MTIKKRKSKYIRPKDENIARIEIQPKDLDIIRTVYDYRFIRTDQLTGLVPGDRTSLEKRLRKLWEHRFLERSFLPIVHGKEPASRRAIYSLDYQGGNILIKNDGVDPQHMKHVLRHNKPEYSYVEHQLMGSQFRAVLTLALAKEPKVKILFWRQDREIRDYIEIAGGNSKKERLPIAPDGYFCIEDERGKMYWFLEVDRYTMSGPRWVEKMLAYYHWWDQKKHQEKFGIRNFRVISVCPSAQQRDARLEITQKARTKVGGRDETLGKKLFWFVSEKDCLLNDPSQLLRPIFRVAKKAEEDQHKILE